MSDEDHVGCVTVRPSEIRGKGSPTVHFDTCSRVQERKPGADFLPAHCDSKCKGRFVIKIMEVQPKDKKCRYGSCKGTVDSGETTHYACVECGKITCTNCVNQSQAKLHVLNIPDWLHGKLLDDLLECIKKQLCARRYISLKRMVCKNAAFLTFLDSAGSPCGLPIGTKSIEFDVSVEGCIEDTRIKVATWQNDKENDKCRRTDREIYVSVCPGKVSTAGMRQQRAAFVSRFPRGAEGGKSCLVPRNVCMAAVLIEIGKCWLERREQNHSREFLGIKGPADLFEYFVPNVAFQKSEMGRSGEKQGGYGRSRGKPADKSKEEQDFNNCRVKFFAELTEAGTRVVREVFADSEKDADFINGFLSVQHLETDDPLPIACVVQQRQEKGNEGEGKMARNSANPGAVLVTGSLITLVRAATSRRASSRAGGCAVSRSTNPPAPSERRAVQPLDQPRIKKAAEVVQRYVEPLCGRMTRPDPAERPTAIEALAATDITAAATELERQLGEGERRLEQRARDAADESRRVEQERERLRQGQQTVAADQEKCMRDQEELRAAAARLAEQQQAVESERGVVKARLAAIARLKEAEYDSPAHWTDALSPAQGWAVVPVPKGSEVFAALRRSLEIGPVGAGHGAAGLVLQGAWRVENPARWREYAVARQSVGDSVRNGELPKTRLRILQEAADSLGPRGRQLPALLRHDNGVNELRLFHGTKPEVVLSILGDGMNERFSGGRFGHGTYFAENPWKCDKYATRHRIGDHPDLERRLYRSSAAVQDCRYIFVCRVVCGPPAETKDGATQLSGAPLWAPGAGLRELAKTPNGGHHGCLLALTGGLVSQYREFVVFRGQRIYPEYLLAYAKAG